MLPPAFRTPLLLTASLSAGLAVGWGLRHRHERGKAQHPPPALAGGTSPEAAGSAPPGGAASFSMERFRAASGLPMHRMLAQVLPNADAALLRALAEHLAARPEFPPDAVWNALLARWVKLDAPAALAWARTVECRTLREIVIKAWAESDLEAALAGVNPSGIQEWAILCRPMAETDPKRALRTILDQRGKSEHCSDELIRRYETLFLSLCAQADPLAALTNFKDDYACSPAFWKCIAAGWALKDPVGCRDWLEGLPADLKKEAIEGLDEAAEKNPAAVAKILSAVPLTDGSLGTFLQLSRTWAAQDAPAATAWVKTNFPEGPLRRQALTQVAWAVMEKNLPAALALMDEIGWNGEKQSPMFGKGIILPGKEEPKNGTSFSALSQNMIDRLIREGSIQSELIWRLGATDPLRALRYLEKADPAVQTQILAGLIPNWFYREPDAATRWLESLPLDKLRASHLKDILGGITGLEPEAARTWAERLPSSPLREALAGLSVEPAALENPAQAVESIPFTDAASRQAALDVIVRDWSNTAPQAALDRLVQETVPHPETCEEVLAEWTLHDPAAASTWVAAQPPGPNRDAAIKGLAASLTDEDAQPDFPAALMWSLSITDPAGRLETAQSILEDWKSNEAEAVEMKSALQTTTALAETERRALLELLPP